MAVPQTSVTFAVLVTNISPGANEKTVSDFFSFCGKITKLYMDKEEGKDTNKAVVEFETESASKTALLLTNALIVDRPIAVSLYASPNAPLQENVPLSPGTPVPEEKITRRDFGGVKDEERTKTSVLAALIASGYVLASDAVTKAKQYDEEHNITLQLKVGVETLKVKVHEIDQQYGISEKAAVVKQQATDKAKKIDEEYKISEKATSAADTVKAATFSAANKAQENPTVKQGLETIKSGWASVTSSVTGLYNEYKVQTVKAIEEKEKERAAHNHPVGAPIQSEEVADTPIQPPSTENKN